MTNAKENQTQENQTQENQSGQCPICEKEFSGNRRNQALGIHRAKAHNKKNSNSAQDLLRKLKADLKEERDRLNTMILACDYRIGQGK